ncbi:MAG: hypothetical protein ACYDBJ_11425 [Aggregatilineales bacterium]
MSGFDQHSPLTDTNLIIDLQKKYGDSACWSHWLNHWLIEPEMIAPLITAWVEQNGNISRIWIKGGKVTPFTAVAIHAAQTQIVFMCRTPVLFGNDYDRSRT